jgi:hypothetical protein
MFGTNDRRVVQFGLGVVRPERRLIQLLELNGFSVDVGPEDMPEDVDAWTDLATLRVIVRPDLSPSARLVALARELSHIVAFHSEEEDCSRAAALLFAGWLLED